MSVQRVLKIGFVMLLTLCATSWGANTLANETTSREMEIIIPQYEHEWWLTRWSDNNAVCQIIVDHQGLPTPDDVYVYCGENLYEDWLSTKACPEAIETNSGASDCKGFYLHKIASERREKTVYIDLPVPTAWFSLEGCSPAPPNNWCSDLPSILIYGEEPLPNDYITRIQGVFNEIPFVCEEEICEVPLRPTPTEGAEMEFWVESSYGDSSEHYFALVRVVDSGPGPTLDSGGWLVDIMSPQWRNDQVNSCAQIWRVFPPLGGPPSWLSSPETHELLASDEPYTYLAGRLITNGLADAGECIAGGLLSNGYASSCGLEFARTEVDSWQNMFDTQIFEASQETGVPSVLIKNLFAIESQFWPGVFNDADEYGFGQLTEMGADTVLLWNQTFFSQFCPLVLEAGVCEKGYSSLEEEYKVILRGAVTIQANADCPDCPAGIDLSHANYSVNLFAQTFQANCQQVNQILSNSSINPKSVSYEDLWRFTLANYHAGSGCLSSAISSFKGEDSLIWEEVAVDLSLECPGVVEYVEEIAK